MRRFVGSSMLSMILFAAPALAQRAVVFPEFVSGGGYTSEFFFTNQGVAQVTPISVSFFNESGDPLAVNSNLGVNSSFTFSLNAGATQLIQITPPSTIVVGYAVASYPTSAPVRASEIFRYVQGGVILTECGVPQQEEGDHYSFPVESNYPNVRTGVALINPAAYNPTPVSETLVLNLIDLKGNIQKTTTIPMASGQHLAAYIDELFPNLGVFNGSISISSPFGVGVLAVRQEGQAFGAPSTDAGPVLGPFLLPGAPIPEAEPNNTVSTAQLISPPTVIAGTIQQAGDVDYYKFTAKAGSILSVVCTTQGLGSNLDSIVEILDSKGNLIAANDQNGLSPDLYPQNDSFVQMVLPADDTYYIVVVDFYNQGGPTWSYRLHVKLM